MAEKSTKKAVHFGAGNIGRGFIGPILSRNGYEVLFLDVNTTVIKALQKQKSYTVEIAGSGIKEELITGVDGMLSTDPKTAQAIACADVITTAAGPDILSRIAPVLAKGLAQREESLKKPIVIACENKIGATALLASCVKERDQATAKKAVFVNCSIDGVVPVLNHPDPLRVRVEDYHEWLTDKTAYEPGNVLELSGMGSVENMQAYVERKIFTLNTAHAITAWLSVMRGHKLIREGIKDSLIRPIVQGAAAESGAGLSRAFGLDKGALQAYREKIINRFENPYIDDTVDRVGRQPLRKLGQADRIFAPIIRCYDYELQCENLVTGAAAGLRFFDENDPESVQLNSALKKQPVSQWVIENLKECVHKEKIAEAVEKAYNALPERLHIKN